MTARGSFLQWLRSLARNILRGRASEADLRADVESYVELLDRRKDRGRHAPDRARRAARLESAAWKPSRKRCGRFEPAAVLAELWQDAGYAGRMARRDPGFTVVAVLTLALGIGANTAIFSVVNAVLLKPLSYRDPDRLVFVWERNPSIGKDRDPVAPPNFQDWKAQNTVFDELGAYRFGGFALSGVDDPEQRRRAHGVQQPVSCARRRRGRRAHVHGRRRAAPRSGRRARARILAAPIRRRQDGRRPIHLAQRGQLRGGWRDAAELSDSRTATRSICTRRSSSRRASSPAAGRTPSP